MTFSSSVVETTDERGCTWMTDRGPSCLSVFIRIYQRFHLLAVISCCALVGCAAPGKRPSAVVRTVPAPYQADAKIIDQDPIAFLRQLRERCTSLDEYRLTFYRQERLGLMATLQPMETIQAAFRREPFSVKFEWPDENMPYYESVYLAGRNDNKLLIRERKGIFPFPPMVRKIDVDLPAKLGKAKNPITAFGLAQLVTRTLGPFDDPAVSSITTIRYLGIIKLEPSQVTAHHLRIEHPQATGYRYTAQDFYIDTQTKLPAGTDLWLPNGQLDVTYRYADVNTTVHLTDADFRLGNGHPVAASQPTGQAGKHPTATKPSTNP